MGTPLSSADNSPESLEASRVAEQITRKEKAVKCIAGLKGYLSLDINDPQIEHFTWNYDIEGLRESYQHGTAATKNLIVTGIGEILLEHRNLERGDIKEILSVFKVGEISLRTMEYERELDLLDKTVSSVTYPSETLEATRVTEQKARLEKAVSILSGLTKYMALDQSDPKDPSYSWTSDIEKLGRCYQEGTTETKNLIVKGISDILLQNRDMERGDLTGLLRVFNVKELTREDMAWKNIQDKREIQASLVSDNSVTPDVDKEKDWMRTYTTDAAMLALADHIKRLSFDLPPAIKIEGELDYDRAFQIVHHRYHTGDDQERSQIVSRLVSITNSLSSRQQLDITDLLNVFDPLYYK